MMKPFQAKDKVPMEFFNRQSAIYDSSRQVVFVGVKLQGKGEITRFLREYE